MVLSTSREAPFCSQNLRESGFNLIGGLWGQGRSIENKIAVSSDGPWERQMKLGLIYEFHLTGSYPVDRLFGKGTSDETFSDETRFHLTFQGNVR